MSKKKQLKKKIKPGSQEEKCSQKKDWKSVLFLGFRGGVKKGENPVQKDWAITLVGSFVMLFVVFVFSGYQFYDTFLQDDSLERMGEEVKNPVVDRLLLEDTLSEYEQKEETFETLQNESPNVVDPSR